MIEISLTSCHRQQETLTTNSIIRQAPIFDENQIPLEDRIRERQLYSPTKTQASKLPVPN